MTYKEPERIWLKPTHPQHYPDDFYVTLEGDTGTEYIRADPAPAWQPIETAPKEWPGFLALPWTLELADVSVTWWIEDEQRWANWDWSKPPVYWLPLPNPPEKSK